MGDNTFSYRLGGWADRRQGAGRPVLPADADQSPGMQGQFEESSGTYWRRRFIMLMVGLSVFAMAAWTLSDALKVNPGKSATGASGAGQSAHGSASGGGAGRGAGGGGGSGGGGSGRVGGGGPAASGSPGGGHGGRSPGGGPAHRSASAGGPSGQSRPSPTSSAGPRGFHGFKPAFCARSSIVLSLAATQLTFGPRQLPAFSLSVVSTQRGDCSFNVGSDHLALVIKEGPTRIWSSGDCASGTGSLISALRRGVPTIVAMSWSRQTSAPSCTSPARLAPPGTYTAYAVEGSLVSAPVTIRLT